MREWLSSLKLSSLALGIVLMLLVLLLPLAGKAQERTPEPQIPDVRLLFDVSSAAAAADPGQVRADAVSLLLRMLPDDGQGGIWVFGDKVSRLVEHGRTDLFWKQLATIHTRSLESRGEKADLPGLWRPRPGMLIGQVSSSVISLSLEADSSIQAIAGPRAMIGISC